jgi:hypothetical protein
MHIGGALVVPGTAWGHTGAMPGSASWPPGDIERVQAVTEGSVGLRVQVAVAVEGEAHWGITGPSRNLLRVGADPHRHGCVRRSWMRWLSRSAFLVAGRHTRARNGITRSGPDPVEPHCSPAGAAQTQTLRRNCRSVSGTPRSLKIAWAPCQQACACPCWPSASRTCPRCHSVSASLRRSPMSR